MARRPFRKKSEWKLVPDNVEGKGEGGVRDGAKIETKPLCPGLGAHLREPWLTLILC